jgi:hypothetical protein
VNTQSKRKFESAVKRCKGKGRSKDVVHLAAKKSKDKKTLQREIHHENNSVKLSSDK